MSSSPLLSLALPQLRELLIASKQPAYRAQQLWRGVLHDGATRVEDITTLPRASRATLTALLSLRTGARITRDVTSRDGTRKFLVELPPRAPASCGGAVAALLREHEVEGGLSAATGAKALPAPSSAPREVEAVLIPAGTRRTLCVSSQSGCSLACSFCATGTQAFGGSLSAADILEQALLARATGSLFTHVVFMGQGEPLLNFRAVSQACHVLTHPLGLALPPRAITISTAGVAPIIPRIADELPGVRLALSLHAPSNALRSQIMGINASWPLAVTMRACSEFIEKRLAQVVRRGVEEMEDGEEEVGGEGKGGRSPRVIPGQRFSGTRRVRVSFEYVMLAGVNDSPAHAHELVALLRNSIPSPSLHAHVNLIPFHPHPGLNGVGGHYVCSSPEFMSRFLAILHAAEIAASIRRSRGEDVLGACGQLRSPATASKGTPLSPAHAAARR